MICAALRHSFSAASERVSNTAGFRLGGLTPAGPSRGFRPPGALVRNDLLGHLRKNLHVMLRDSVNRNKEYDITGLIHSWQSGDRAAEQLLFELVLPDLRRIAVNLMKGERRDLSIQANDLVSESYLKLVAAKDRTWESRGHFYALAARVMRNYLVDRARRRPGVEFVPLDAALFDGLILTQDDPDALLSLNCLLDELAIENPLHCQIVEMRYFLGLSNEQTAELLHMNLRTMQRRWQDARHWLFVRLRNEA